MAITSQLTFVGTGKPMKARVNPQVNRRPGWKGVVQSGNKSSKELSNQIRQNTKPQPQQIGQGAVKLQKASGISVNLTI